jgi:predicted restriction endonuclease
MTDRYIKLLLLAIAVGLWMNVAAQWVRPVAVQATSEVTEQQSWENMSYSSLSRDRTFRRAVQRVVGLRCSVSGSSINC